MTDGYRATKDGGLDGWVAEALPGRRERHDVRRGIEPGAIARALVDDSRVCTREDARELRVVVLFRVAQEPVGRVERFGQLDRLRDVLALDRPHRVDHQPLVGIDGELCPCARAVAQRLMY